MLKSNLVAKRRNILKLIKLWRFNKLRLINDILGFQRRWRKVFGISENQNGFTINSNAYLNKKFKKKNPKSVKKTYEISRDVLVVNPRVLNQTYPTRGTLLFTSKRKIYSLAQITKGRHTK
jgi:hypothetical protein